MTFNGQARFGDDYSLDIRTIDGIEYLDTHPDEMDLSAVQPPEITSQNAADWTYRGRFMRGKELEYEATLQAYRDIYEGKSNNHTKALMGCRTFASSLSGSCSRPPCATDRRLRATEQEFATLSDGIRLAAEVVKYIGSQRP